MIFNYIKKLNDYIIKFLAKKKIYVFFSMVTIKEEIQRERVGQYLNRPRITICNYRRRN